MMASNGNKKDFLWGPSKFYTEEESIYNSDFSSLEKKPNSPFGSCSSSDSSSSCYGSCLSTPVASEFGSTESETDQDDDYIAELTRQMTYDMLQDDDSNNKYDKEWSLDGASQPKKWSDLFPSKKETQIMGNSENLKTKGNKFNKYQNRESLSTTSLSPTSVIPSKLRSPNGLRVDFQSKQALIDDPIRAINFHKFKQEQIMKQRKEFPRQSNWYNKEMETNYYKQEVRPFQNMGTACGTRYGQNDSWVNASLKQQQKTGSDGMRAAFLSEPGSKSGCSGTGVFLPRGVGNIPDTSKRQGSSTVLLPARVVQALKLHFDKMGVPSRSNGAISFLHEDSITGDMKFGLQLQEKNQSWTAPSMDHHRHQEKCLPPEWTY